MTVQGFIQGGGAGISPPPSHNFPPPEILKLSMAINVLSQVLSNNLVPDCNLRGSKFKACPQTPLVGTRYYHPATTMFCPPPPPKLKILYETLQSHHSHMTIM